MHEHPHKVLQRLDAYLKGARYAEATISNQVAGNARFIARFRRRVDRICADAARLDRFMAEHPPAADPE